MFDIGPSELLVIFVVALLVIGPERLPTAVKTASLWVGRFRRSFHKIKAEVEKELNADEIRRQLHNESILAEVEDAKKQAKAFASDMERAATEELALEDKTSGKPETESVEQTPSPDTPVSGDTTATATDQSEPTVGGEIKQAVSYVNDISREVEASAKEIQEKIKNPGSVKKSSSGDKA